MTATAPTPYRVLARKYRPESFDQLIGQDALVRTLSNALRLGRLAHAFILTGVRGIGKTSTARILARGLNCEGADGKGGPTLNPCGSCRHCQDIANARHIDVLEMDAASNTGVDDVREIIDGAAYRPVSARFKIYIIDEVHMLSRSAFNALLKTLEEPPDNVKFIFATTEIRKVPVTILSRCQRFDLRRVPVDMLSQHLAAIAQKESITAEPEALRLVARAAEGSVRDALSLLDQAAAMQADKLDEQAIIDMLGQAETGQILAILSACFSGDTALALSLFANADAGGADAETVIADLLDIIHQASLMAAGARLEDIPEAYHNELKSLSSSGIARLGRAWQLVLAGHRDLRDAPDPKSAAQMILIRLAHLAPMPTPAEIIKTLDAQPAGARPPGLPDKPPPPAPVPAQTLPDPASIPAKAPPQGHESHLPQDAAADSGNSGEHAPPRPESAQEEVQEEAVQEPVVQEPAVQEPAAQEAGKISMPQTAPATFKELVGFIDSAGEHILAARLRRSVRPVQLDGHRLEIAITDDRAEDIPGLLAKTLSGLTGTSWLVSVCETGGGPTLAEEEAQQKQRDIDEAAGLPLVASVLDKFSGAEISAVKELGGEAGAEDDSTQPQFVRQAPASSP